VSICEICDKEFILPNGSTRRTCGGACSSLLAAKTRASKTTVAKSKPKTKPKTRWSNPHGRGVKGERSDLNGIYMRSRWEANVARFLNILLLCDKVASWEYEPRIFTFPVKRGITKYTPDFLINLPDGSHYWLEVKGWMDKPSKIKIKRFGIHYPNESLIILDEKQYRSMEKEFKDLIPNWELKPS